MNEDDQDPQAWLVAAFMERRDALRRALTARAGPEEAEDLLHDLYLRISQSAPTEPIHNPQAYLFRLAFNLLIDVKRSQSRSARRDDKWSRDHSVLRGGEDRAPETPADQQVIAREALARVMKVVGDMPPQTQRAFRLHKLEGLSYREVAAAMTISQSAVEKHMSRALKRLAEINW